MAGRAVTRDDVARRAGVSTAVVSYVLNDGPRPVSREKRARVLEAIAELGYRRDAVAAALSSRRSNILGLLLPDATNPFFADLAGHLEAFMAHRVDGVIAIVADLAAPLPAPLAQLAGRVVLLDRVPREWAGPA